MFTATSVAAAVFKITLFITSVPTNYTSNYLREFADLTGHKRQIAASTVQVARKPMGYRRLVVGDALIP
jgi:hypothetical protein